MLLVLKIPVVYLGFVIWWAVRADPRPEEPVLVPVVADTPPHLGPASARDRRLLRPERPGPARRPPRGRLTHVRAQARR